MTGRPAVWVVAIALCAAWGLCSLGACASGGDAPSEGSEAGADSGTAPPAELDSAVSTNTGDAQSIDPPRDAAPPPSCPGSLVPPAASTACAVDTSGACPPCAAWGFACTTWSSPQMSDASAASFCHATALEGGAALLCCTQPACVVSTLLGGCDASSATRYDCSGGAVPAGACEWLGAPAPNDYCCQ